MKKLLLLLLSISLCLIVALSCELATGNESGSSSLADSSDQTEQSGGDTSETSSAGDYCSYGTTYYDGRVEPCEEMCDSPDVAAMFGYSPGTCSRSGISGTCTHYEQGIKIIQVFYSAYTSAAAAEFYCTKQGGTFISGD